MTAVTAAPVQTPLRRPGRLVPWITIGLWIVLLAVAGPLAGKLSGVQRDSVVDYLPASADSTKVAQIEAQLPGGESTDLLVVYHRGAGLTAADRAIAAGQIARIGSAWSLSATPRPVTSSDGTTLLYPVSSTKPGTDSKAQTAFVDDVRVLAGGGHGLTVQVGGAGAYGTDAAAVYGSLGGPLLYTTVAVVAVLLVLIYRSPTLWLVPLAAAGAADAVSMAVTYLLNRGFGLGVSGQSSGVTTILVFGVGTDYALLLVARYREELFRVERPYDAMRTALRKSGPAILASAATVSIGLLCLLAADLNSSRGMGPAAAVGVASGLLAMTTLLPAVLVVVGRRVFWPFVPAYGGSPRQTGIFGGIGRIVSRRPVVVLVGGVVVLGALALGIFALPGTLKQADSFTSTPESTAAAKTISAAFPERNSQPVVVIAPSGQASSVSAVARATSGVALVSQGRAVPQWTEFFVTTRSAPESAAETATITALRERLPGSYVGGPSAQNLDLEKADARDGKVVIPLVLAVVLVILVVLLRSLVAPLLLIAAVVAVWGAALGLGGLLFGPVFGYAGTDPGLPLLSFVFLVALGVDYGIFLMHRMRQEALAGALPRDATVSALQATGGVITSAGLVLTATFSVLLNMPLVSLAELGFVIAVGVLLDTFVVRTLLVTSAAMLLRRALWWPGRLSRRRSGGRAA